MSSFKKDYEYGIQKEQELCSTISKDAGITLKKIDKTFSVMDYKSEDGSTYAELKSRKCEKSKYPDTIVGMDKVIAAKRLVEYGKHVDFYFNFTDGLYKYPYNEEMFEWAAPFRRHQRTDFNDKEKLYCYIPTEKLTEVVKHKTKTNVITSKTH